MRSFTVTRESPGRQIWFHAQLHRYPLRSPRTFWPAPLGEEPGSSGWSRGSSGWSPTVNREEPGLVLRAVAAVPDVFTSLTMPTGELKVSVIFRAVEWLHNLPVLSIPSGARWVDDPMPERSDATVKQGTTARKAGSVLVRYHPPRIGAPCNRAVGNCC